MKFKVDKKPGHWTIVALCVDCGVPCSVKARGTEQEVRSKYEETQMRCRICDEVRLNGPKLLGQ